MDYVTRIDLDYTRTAREIKDLDCQNASLGLVFLVFVRIEFKKASSYENVTLNKRKFHDPRLFCRRNCILENRSFLKVHVRVRESTIRRRNGERQVGISTNVILFSRWQATTGCLRNPGKCRAQAITLASLWKF